MGKEFLEVAAASEVVSTEFAIKVRNQFTVRGHESEYDWRRPIGNPTWTASYKDSAAWVQRELTDETDRIDLLRCFGLQHDAETVKIPLSTLREMPPSALIELRRTIERRDNMFRLEVRNMKGRGDSTEFSAETCI